jgi:long-chain acyl-CoA synthetase
VDRLPPRFVRRLVICPLAVALALVLIGLSPVAFAVAFVVDLLMPRHWRTTRLVAVAVITLAFEVVGIVALFGLWIASGFGLTIRSPSTQDRHHRFMRWWLSGLLGVTDPLVGIRIEIEDRQPPRAGPVLVFSRHAGPWDSFLLVHALVRGYDRHPRVVMKAAMQWDPVVDIVGNRTPNRFVRPHAKDAHRYIEAIGDLAKGLGDHDAFVIFPEGGNFTEQRRRRGIARLLQRGDARHAREAEGMRNLIAPHPGGVMAAIRSAPEADVVFVAHEGLEDYESLLALWRAVPLSEPIRGRYWRVPPSKIPPPEEQVDWLFNWWGAIDRWIASRRERGAAKESPQAPPEGVMTMVSSPEPWLAHYPKEVPRTVEPIPDINAYQMLAGSAERHPDRPALAWFGRHLTFAELEGETARFSAALARLRIGRGDRVGLLLPNSPQYVIAYYAILRLGAIIVGNNPLYTVRELAHQLSDAGTSAVVALDSLYPTLAEVSEQVDVGEVIVTGIEDYMGLPKRWLAPLKLRRDARADGKPWPLVPRKAKVLRWRKLMAESRSDPLPSVAEVDAGHDPAGFVYTGGTTGLSKGAMLTHRNLVANAMQCAAWFIGLRDGGEAIMCVLPFFHCYGMTVGMNLGMLKAAKLVLLPRWDLEGVLHEIQRERPTLFPGIPKIYVTINEAPGVERFDLSSIKFCLSGAGALPGAVAERFRELTGATLVEGYGLTECSPVAVANPLDGSARVGSIGVPIPDTDCRVVGLDDPGRAVPVGEQGELWIHGSQVMLGYWNHPEETANVIHEGWLRTGDIGVMDEDGFIRIVDRLKDMIKVSGFAVYPAEIEEVLYGHPKILKACVVGVPDSQGGEMVKAFVVLRPDETATPQEIIDWCKDPETGFAWFRVPKEVEIRDSLPETIVGKVLRRVLLEEEKAKVATQAGGSES